MSRWEHWSRGSKPSRFFGDFLKEGPVDPVDGGNPSGSGVMSPGDRARSMGLQSDGKGGYIDPKSGQKVAQTVNNELVFYSTAPGGGVTTDGAGGMQTARPTSAWQDPITGLMTVPPGKAETPQEIAAVPDPVPAQMPHGYANFIQQQKQIAYAQDAQQREMNRMMGQQPAQVEQPPEMAPNASSTVAPDPAPMPQQEEYTSDKLFDRMKGVPTPFHVMRDRMKGAQAPAQVTQQAPEPDPGQTQQTAPPAEPSRDPEDLRARALNSFKDWTTDRISADDRMRTKYEPMRKALDHPSVSPATRNAALHALGEIYDYEGRDNDASSDLTKSEYHALRDNKQRLIEAYGGQGSDGSTPNIASAREFIQSITGNEVDEETLNKVFKSLSPSQKKIFKGGTFSSPEAGFRRFFQQQGRSGYTGLPLSMDAMDMEHFIDSAQATALLNKYDGKPDDMSPEDREMYDFILSDENQFWERQGPNQQKSANSIADFYKQNVDIYDQFGDDFFDFREMQINPTRLRLKGDEKDYIKQHLVDSSDPENLTLADLSPEDFDNHIKAIGDMYDSEKTNIANAISERFDERGLMGLTPTRFQRAIDDENSDISEEDRGTWNMLRTLKEKFNGWKGDPERRLLSALGIPTGMTMTQRARSSNMSPDAYRGLARMLRNTPKEKQGEIINNIKETLKAANSAANSAKETARSDKDVKAAMYGSLMNSDLLKDFDATDFPGLAALIQQYKQMNEGMEMYDDVDDFSFEEGFDIEDIMDIVKMLLTMEEDRPVKPKKKAKKKVKEGLTYERFLS